MEVKLNNEDFCELSDSLNGIVEAAISHGSWSAKMGMKSSAQGYVHILNMAKDAMEVLYLWNATYSHATQDIELALSTMEDNRSESTKFIF